MNIFLAFPSWWLPNRNWISLTYWIKLPRDGVHNKFSSSRWCINRKVKNIHKSWLEAHWINSFKIKRIQWINYLNDKNLFQTGKSCQYQRCWRWWGNLLEGKISHFAKFDIFLWGALDRKKWGSSEVMQNYWIQIFPSWRIL